MKSANRTSDYRRAGATSLAVLGLVSTPAVCVVAALFLAHSVPVAPRQGLNRIGVDALETGSSPLWLAPVDDPATPQTPNDTLPFNGGAGPAPPSSLADLGPPTNATGQPQPGDSTDRPGNEPRPPGTDDGPSAPDPADDMILARVESSAPTGTIQLASYGGSGTTVMALSLSTSQPPATCASGRFRRVVVPLRSSDESVATVTPETLSFDCVGSELVTITPAAPGDATIRVGRPTMAPESTKVEVKDASLTVQVTEAPPPNTEPTVRVPRPVTIAAAGRRGQTFAWKAVGSDPEDGELPAICTPAPGSMFPIGTTTVTCAVTDSRGSTDSATFDVTVVDGPIEDTEPGGGDGGGDLPDDDKPYAPSVLLPPAAAVDDRGQWFKDRVLVNVVDNGDRIPLDGTPSGVDRRSFPGVILVNEAGRHTISGITVRDRAGNVSNPAPAITFNIDRHAPIVELLCPIEPVELGERRSANWIARDEGSGLATEPAGSLELITARPGTFTATVPRGTAVDKVGHVGEAARCRYRVLETKPEREAETPNEPAVDAAVQPEAGTSTRSETVKSSPSEDPSHSGSVIELEPPRAELKKLRMSRTAGSQEPADDESDAASVDGNPDTSEDTAPG